MEKEWLCRRDGRASGRSVGLRIALEFPAARLLDAEQGLKLIQLIRPDVTIPIHYDDYDVFASPLEDRVRSRQKSISYH
jgi:hypothetical protein